MALDPNFLYRKMRDWIARGVQIIPGSDKDVDLLRVDVTGSPKVSWDESEDAFDFSHGIQMEGTAPNPPKANTLYKHPNTGGQIAFALDASSAEAALAGVLDSAQGGIAAGSLEAWHEIGAASEPGFANSWVNTGGTQVTAAFRKLPSGIVEIKGLIKSGTVGGKAFTLPAGYRPGANYIFSTDSNNAFGRVLITTNGRVTPSTGNNAGFAVNFSYMGEQ